MNNSTLVGRTTRDAELKYTTGGMAICDYTVAIDKKLKKEAIKKLKEQGLPTANFFSVRTFGKQAENDATYVGKGSLVSVAGSHETSDYKNADGDKKQFKYFLAREVQYLDTKKPGITNSDKETDKSTLTKEEIDALKDDDNIPF